MVFNSLQWSLGDMLLKAPEDGTGNVTGNEPQHSANETQNEGQSDASSVNENESASQGEAAAGGEADRPWRNPKVEQRISDLTKQRYAAEAKARELEQKLALLEKKEPPKITDPNEIPPEILNAKLAELRFNEKSNEIFQKGSKKFGDFPTVVNEVRTALGGFPPGVIEAAMELDSPEEVLYHLGKDLGAAGDIFLLPPARQGAAVARYAASVVKQVQQAQQGISRAPTPINPVDGRVKKDFTPENTDLPIAEWMKARQTQAKGRPT